MSADNGIYILQSKDGFRVTYASAIDNLYWFWGDERLYDESFVKSEQERGVENPYMDKGESRDELNPRELIEYFGNCEIIKTRIEALVKADEISRDYDTLEYGISFIKGWEDKEFPTVT